MDHNLRKTVVRGLNGGGGMVEGLANPNGRRWRVADGPASTSSSWRPGDMGWLDPGALGL